MSAPRGGGVRGTLASVMAAELTKLRGLPQVAATVAATVAAACLLPLAVTPAQTVRLLQAGFILLGVLAAASEYTGGQIRTTLMATPRRLLALAGKAAACAAVAAATAVTALSAAALAGTLRGAYPPLGWWPAAGAVTYLVAIGLLAHAAAVTLRGLTAPLVTMLCLVLIVSPLLAAYTTHARWLPEAAGARLYLGGDAPAGGAGVLVLAAWIAAAGAAAAIGFCKRDA